MGKLLTVLLFLMAEWFYAQEHKMEQLEPFYIIGITIKTTNEDGKCMEDMGQLWGRFFAEGISQSIPNRISDDIYSVFTEYESDYRKGYTAVLGHKVATLEAIPDGCVGIQIPGETYQKMHAKGKMPDAVVDKWKEIWEKDDQLNRAYTADFEVYGEKANNGSDSEVDIFLAINNDKP